MTQISKMNTETRLGKKCNIALKYPLIDLNDSGLTFDQIADYLDGHYELPNLK
jgi:hypothetical protein